MSAAVGPVRVKVTVELGASTVEEVVEIDRSRWERFTPYQRQRLISQEAEEVLRNEVTLRTEVLGADANWRL